MMSTLRPRPDKAVWQFSFVDALVAGLLDGAFTSREVAQRGDFGLGCGDALDGELLMFDGVMHLCRGDGSVRIVGPDERLPFAEVVVFEPTLTRSIESLDESGFDRLIEQVVPSDNLFYAMRIDGTFNHVMVREAVRQAKPYRGLAQAAENEHVSTSGSTTGTLVGFRGPDVFQGLTVADSHTHYINDARSWGGHVLTFEIESATLSMEAYSTFTLRLPEVDSYLEATLSELDSDAAIRLAEGSSSTPLPDA
jgi:acetolactate decarboxylase